MKKIAVLLLMPILCLSLFLSSVMLTGCSESNDNNKKEEKQIALVTDGAFNYAICRPDNTPDAVKSLIGNFRSLLRGKLMLDVDLIDGDTAPEGKHKLSIELVSEGSQLSGGENQFRIVTKDGDISISADRMEVLELALDTFIAEYGGSDKTIAENGSRTWQCEAKYGSYEVSNPINPQGDDPFVTQKDGVYYYCWSSGVNGTGGVKVSKADSIDKISKDGGAQVYSAPAGTAYSHEYWAPELHYVRGDWYIYVAADDGEDANHRMYVLKGTSQDPTKPFEMVGKICDSTDMWAIDGTVLELDGELYFIWSGWATPGAFGNQHLYIAHMSDPTTIDSKRVQISTHDRAWEGPLNEGPCVLQHDGDTFIVYSGNGSWTDDYCLGYLRLTGSDPLKKTSWEKFSNPLLSKSSAAYGPGHCSITTAADGSYWVIYHANLVSGTGWSGRSVWIAPIEFGSKGNPKTIKTATTVDYPTVTWVVTGEIS